jgi:WD40 repeat protein
MVTKSQGKCQECGAPIDVARTGGVCAACLLLGATDDPTETSSALGRIAGHDLLEIIARGGMGIVYRARQQEPDREVALKALPGAELLSEEARQRFGIEAQTMARLEHPAIVPVYEVGEEDGTPFFTMKLAVGGTLARRIGDYAGEWRGIAELVARIAEAVHYAHARGVLHRDLKPGNILFDEDGRAAVSDFGLAKILGGEADLTRTIALMGTPNYMAPELTRGGKGAATTACDVWSLGVMLYELLAGFPPFRGDNLATVLRQLNEEEPGLLPREVPRDLAVIAGRALQKNPARRYASAEAMAEDLRRWLAGDPILARRQPVAEQAWRWLRRHPGRMAVLLLVVGGIGLLLWRDWMLTLMNRETEVKNRKLRTELSLALVEQAESRLGDNSSSRRPKLEALLSQAAATAPSMKARSVAASLLSLPHAVETGERIPFRELLPHGEIVIPTADLKRRLDYKNTNAKKTRRLIRLVALDAPVDNPATFWQRELDGASALYADLSDSGQQVVFANGRLTELWDTARNEFISIIDAASPRFPDIGKVWLVDLHPTEPMLAWMDRGGGLWAWRFPDGEKQLIGRPTAPVMGIILSPQADKIAVSNGAGVEIWSVSERALALSCVSPGASHPLHWSERGGLLAAHRKLPEIAVIRGGTVAATFRWTGSRCVELTSFPGTWRALCVNGDNLAMAWDMRTGMELFTASGGRDALRTGVDGSTFCLSLASANMRLIRMEPSPAFREHDCPFVPAGSGGQSISVCDDGRLLATTAGSELLLWDSARGRLITHWEPEPGRTGVDAWFDPRGGAIFTSVSGGQGIRRHSLAWQDDRLIVGEPQLAAATQGWRIQQTDGTCSRFVLRQTGVLALWEGDGTLPVRELHRLKHSFARHYLSPLLTYGYSSISSRELRLFDGLSSRTLSPIVAPTWAGKAHFSDDERWMFTRSRAWFRLFSTEDWRERFHVGCYVPGDDFGLACFSPDATLAALEHSWRRVGLYTIPEGRHLIDFHAPQAGNVEAFNFSKDGRKFFQLTDDHRLCEWDLTALRAELARLGLPWEE